MDRLDAEGVAEWIRTEQVTTWNGPPALLHSLATNDAVAADPISPRSNEVWTGGADCPETIRSMFEAKFGLPVLATYGLSEAPTVVAIDGRDGQHVDGSSGQPLPHLRVRIAEDDEICVSAADDRYRPMLGYWERPDATAETLRDGELHTGDVGFIDDDGQPARARPQEPRDHPRRRQRVSRRSGTRAADVRRSRCQRRRRRRRRTAG